MQDAKCKARQAIEGSDTYGLRLQASGAGGTSCRGTRERQASASVHKLHISRDVQILDALGMASCSKSGTAFLRAQNFVPVGIPEQNRFLEAHHFFLCIEIGKGFWDGSVIGKKIESSGE